MDGACEPGPSAVPCPATVLPLLQQGPVARLVAFCPGKVARQKRVLAASRLLIKPFFGTNIPVQCVTLSPLS